MKETSSSRWKRKGFLAVLGLVLCFASYVALDKQDQASSLAAELDGKNVISWQVYDVALGDETWIYEANAPPPASMVVGHWQIEYDQFLRTNSEGLIEILYHTHDLDADSYDPIPVAGLEQYPEVKLSASLDSFGLKIAPAPAQHEFDIDQIVQTGEDLQTWILSGKETGEFQLLLNLSNTIGNNPLGLFSNSPNVYANDVREINSGSGQFALPVTVLTRWGFSDVTEELLRYVVSFVGFVLMLPFVQNILSVITSRRIARPPNS